MPSRSGIKHMMRRHTALGLIVAILLLLSCAAAATDTAAARASSNSSTSSHAVAPAPSLTRYGHKHLLPLSPNDIGLCITVAFSLFIASGAGVGGGILVVPALLMIGGFGSVDGVGLSNITVLSLAVATMFFQISRRSPVRDGPLIDWDLVMLFGPPSVVGSISGSYINMIIPPWVTKVTLFLLLIPITWRMVQKARTLYKKESKDKRAAKQAQQDAAAAAAGKHAHHSPLHRISETYCSLADNSSIIADEFGADLEYIASPKAAIAQEKGMTLPVAAHPHDSCTSQQKQQQQQQHPKKALDSAAAPPAAPAGFGHSKDVINILDTNVGLSTEVAAAAEEAVPVSCWNLNPSHYTRDAAQIEAVKQKIAKEEAAQLPILQVGLLVVIIASVVVTNVTGGSLVVCGTWRYWLLVLSPLPLMLIVWGIIRQHVLWKADVKSCLGQKHAGDLKWDARNTVVYPLICISAGLIAGLLGLGGGLILTPLMLELGVHPAVSVASSQITMLIGNSTSAIVYAVAGAIPWDYGVTLITIGFISALLGQIIISWLVKKLGRSSLIVMVLSVMFTLALGASLTVVITTMVDIGRHPHKLTARKAVCIN